MDMLKVWSELSNLIYKLAMNSSLCWFYLYDPRPQLHFAGVQKEGSRLSSQKGLRASGGK